MRFSLQEIARMCHDTNRAYCIMLGDHSHSSWEYAPVEQRESAVNGVLFHINNPDASPSASHENWLKRKAADGWKYAPVKNIETKEHPSFLPFDDLPITDQVKDRLFKAIVHAMLVEEVS